MTDRKVIIIVILFVAILLGIQQYFIWNSPKHEDVLLQKIVELESKIDLLSEKKDSIRIAIDSTHIKVVENEKHYQERVDVIISQPYSVDSSYVSDYIGRYIESHSSYFQ